MAAAAKSKRDMEVVLCCPYPFLAPVAEVCKGSKVAVGAEDVFTEDKGAFTGGVAISQVNMHSHMCMHLFFARFSFILIPPSMMCAFYIAYSTFATVNSLAKTLAQSPANAYRRKFGYIILRLQHSAVLS